MNLRDKFLILFALLLFAISAEAAKPTYNGENYRREVTPTKNLILMIPDGTSVGVLSATRWYKAYKEGALATLAVDPYLCGLVSSYSSNAPISCSAPSGSVYNTGMISQAGNVGVYPQQSADDLVAVDPEMGLRPLANLLEAARLKKGKATGLVVKCEFPHATPAATSSHFPHRDGYTQLASQMAYQGVDVLFGGGTSLVTDDMRSHFERNNTSYYADDIESFRAHKEGRVWALWDYNLPYAHDHNGERVPYLAEMTESAIELLSQNDNGFFLMVEGSMVDWAAHANDPIGIITEFEEFDKAVAVAMEFAERDGNTTVVIVPDHGNAGFTIGNSELEHCTTASLEKLFGQMAQFKKSLSGIYDILKEEESKNFGAIFKELTNIELSEQELQDLIAHRDGELPENYMEVGYSESLWTAIEKIIKNHTHFGFCSYSHTGEDVFLAAYHPNSQTPTGVNSAMELNHYMADVLGLGEGERLPDLTDEFFVPHTKLFSQMDYEIDKTDSDFPLLRVTSGGKSVSFPAHKSIAIVNGESYELGSLVVYIEERDEFFLPKWSLEFLIDRELN